MPAVRSRAVIEADLRSEAGTVHAPEHLPAPFRWLVQRIYYDLLEPNDSFTVVFRKAVVAVGLPLGLLIMLNGAWHLATATTWSDWVVGSMQLTFVLFLLCYAVVRQLKVVPAPIIDAMLALVWAGVATLAVVADNAQLLALMGAAYLAVPFTQPVFPRAHAATVALLGLVICYNKAAIPQSLTADPDAPFALAVPGTSLPPFRVRAAASFATLIMIAIIAAGINYVAQVFRRQICQARRTVFVAHTIAEKLGRYRTADAARVIALARGAPTQPFDPSAASAAAQQQQQQYSALPSGACPYQQAGGERFDAVEVSAADDTEERFRNLVAGADPELLDALDVIIDNMKQLRPHLPNWLVREVGASTEPLLDPLGEPAVDAIDDAAQSVRSRETAVDLGTSDADGAPPLGLATHVSRSDDDDDASIEEDFGSAGERVVRRRKPGVVLLPQHRLPLRLRRANIARVRVRVDHITASAAAMTHRRHHHKCKARHHAHTHDLAEVTERIVAAITAHARTTGAAMHGLFGDCAELSWGAVTIHACAADPAVRFLARIRDDPALGRFDTTAAPTTTADCETGSPPPQSMDVPSVATAPPHVATLEDEGPGVASDGRSSPLLPPLHHSSRDTSPPLLGVTAVGMSGPAHVLLAGTRGDVAGITIHAPWTAAFDAVDAVARRLDTILIDEDTAAAATNAAAMRAACAVRVPERCHHASTERAPSPRAGSHQAGHRQSTTREADPLRRASVPATGAAAVNRTASSSGWSAGSSSGRMSHALSASTNVTGTPPATARSAPHTAGAEILMPHHLQERPPPPRKAPPSAVIRCFEVFDETHDFGTGMPFPQTAAAFNRGSGGDGFGYAAVGGAAEAVVAAMHASVTEALDLCLQRRFTTALKNLTALPPMYETLYFTPALADLRARAALGAARERRDSHLDGARGAAEASHDVAQLRTSFDDSAAGGSAITVIPRCLWW